MESVGGKYVSDKMENFRGDVEELSRIFICFYADSYVYLYNWLEVGSAAVSYSAIDYRSCPNTSSI